MAKVPSASTLSSVAYLTETGRRFLFGKDSNGNPIRFEDDGTDNFKIVEFALFDSDRNYTITNDLESGDIPDIAGTNDNSCLKTASDLFRRNKIAFSGDIPESKSSNFEYVVEPENSVIDTQNYRQNNLNQNQNS